MNKTLKRTIIITTFATIFVLVLALVGALVRLNRQSETSAHTARTDAHTSGQLILGFSQIGSESAWRTRNTQSIFEAAKENNIQILFDDAQQKQENQLIAIRSFIVYQVDVIAFVPIVETGWDNVLQEAKDAGIPVIIVDRQIDADESLFAGFLGENGFLEGKSAGDFLLSKIEKLKAQKPRRKNEANGSIVPSNAVEQSGANTQNAQTVQNTAPAQTQNSPIYIEETFNILELSGTENSSVVTERARGFRSVISQNPSIRIIHSEDGDFLRSRGKEIMDKIIRQNGGLSIDGQPIHAIYSHNDSMTLGMLDSFTENNINPKSVIIISIDAEQKSIDALTEGKLNCVVECNPNLGPTLMELVKNIAEGNPIPRITYMKETVFTENDDFSLYEPRGY